MPQTIASIRTNALAALPKIDGRNVDGLQVQLEVFKDRYFRKGKKDICCLRVIEERLTVVLKDIRFLSV